MNLITSNYSDSNINHIFNVEVKALWDFIQNKNPEDYGIFLKNFESNPVQNWRRGILNALVPRVYTGAEAIPNNVEQIVPLSFGEWIPWIKDAEEGVVSHYFGRMAEHIKTRLGRAPAEGNEVVLLQRSKVRQLFDVVTRLPLECKLAPIFSAAGIQFRTVFFENSNLEYQFNSLKSAKVLIAAHGAGLTNLFMLPKDAIVFEASFRNHWYCDPVCDAHFQDAIPFTQNCGGKLMYKSYYHKIDFIKLAQVFEKRHYEFPIVDAEGWATPDRNPIGKQKLFVDPDALGAEVLKNFR
jgi:hypothetical protein